MRATWLLAALICACGDKESPPPADLAPDDGSAPVTFVCAQPLADYCAQQVCITDLSAAETTMQWCVPTGGGPFAYDSTCAEHVLVYVSGIDAGTVYVYDATTGALEAVLAYANVSEGCLAGPSEIEIGGCRGQSPICHSGP